MIQFINHLIGLPIFAMSVFGTLVYFNRDEIKDSFKITIVSKKYYIYPILIGFIASIPISISWLYFMQSEINIVNLLMKLGKFFIGIAISSIGIEILTYFGLPIVISLISIVKSIKDEKEKIGLKDVFWIISFIGMGSFGGFFWILISLGAITTGYFNWIK